MLQGEKREREGNIYKPKKPYAHLVSYHDIIDFSFEEYI
jgi:hypothetical protein